MRTPLAALPLLLVTVACEATTVRADASAATTAIARPEGCLTVAPSAALQAVLDDPRVAAVCLTAGTYGGPLRIARAVTLWGPRDAVIHADRPGSTIEVTGAGATLLGFSIDGRGGRFDQADAAVHVASARDVRIEGVMVVNAVFGFVVEQCERVQLVRNTLHGSRDPAIGMRGDTMRLWETKESRIEGNVVLDGRDILVWYSRGNTIVDNRIEGGRYGIHFMYSHDTEVARNQVRRAVVGVFAMYSRGLRIRDNLIGGASGAAGMGIGLKESGNLELIGNRLIRNTAGIYIDSSPLQATDHLRIARNELRLDGRGVVFHASGHRVEIVDNDFVDNDGQIEVDGGGDAQDVTWRDNHFDDYAGYDLDGDGRGDVAYELRSLSNQLTSSHPGLALFRGTLALGLVDAAAHLDPLYQPRAVLTDPSPRMAPHAHDRAERITP